jgi:hypothetical protein
MQPGGRTTETRQMVKVILMNFSSGRGIMSGFMPDETAQAKQHK